MSRLAHKGTLAIAAWFTALAVGVWVERAYLDAPTQRIEARLSDVFLHAYPTAVFMHRELQRGNLPLWNPYQMAGQPFMALHVTGVLYPPNIVAMGLLPAGRALEALAIFHLALAALFTWLFTARLGLASPARVVAALRFSAPTRSSGACGFLPVSTS